MNIDVDLLKPLNALLKWIRDDNAEAIRNRMEDSLLNHLFVWETEFETFFQHHFVQFFQPMFKDDDDQYPVD